MVEERDHADAVPEIQHADLSQMLRLLAPATLEFEQTVADGLVMQCPECGTVAGVTVRPCFPLTQPDRFIIFCDAEGQELGMLMDAEALHGPARKTLRDELAKQHFLPIITRVIAIDLEFHIPIWQVETNCGPRRLDLRSNHDVHRLANGRIYVRDADGNGYLVPDVNKLDAASRELIDLYV